MSQPRGAVWAGSEAESPDRRLRPRVAVEGDAIWRVGSVEGKGTILDLSLGGIQISHELDPPPPVGAAIELTLHINTRIMVGVSGRIVHTQQDRMGIRYENPSSEFMIDLLDSTEGIGVCRGIPDEP